MRAHVTGDAAVVLDAAGAFLRAKPVEHNLLLTLLGQREANPEPGCYAWAADASDEVCGVLFLSPLSFFATLSPMPLAATDALVAEIVDVVPDLRGVAGVAATSAAFAGAWATRRRTPAHPDEGQRLYRLTTLVAPAAVAGAARQATGDDADLLNEWAAAFAFEVGEDAPPGRQFLASRRVFVWDHDGESRCMVGATSAIAGVARIGPVYTPPEHRRGGYAAALTAHVTRVLLDEGATPILYTQLSNPTSNAVYQRLGYEPISELTRYTFG